MAGRRKSHVADELNIRPQQVQAVVSLINEGCTVPFISRYRKEKHGSLDEVQVRDCDHLFKSRMNLENRRIEIIRGIFAQGKLTRCVGSWWHVGGCSRGRRPVQSQGRCRTR